MDLSPGPLLRFLARRLDLDSPVGLHLTLAVVGAVVFGGGFLAIAEDVVPPASFAIDRVVSAWLGGLASPQLTRIMWAATLLADTPTMAVETAAIALGLLVWGRPRRAIFVAGTVAAGTTLAYVLKDVFVRPRPPASLALVATPQSYSFPSGHAIAALLLCGTLASILLASRRPAAWKAAGVLAALALTVTVGLSRVYLGVHWFSDVAASWMLGAALLSVAASALAAWERLRPVVRTRAPGRLAWRLLALAALTAAAVWMLAAEVASNPLR